MSRNFPLMLRKEVVRHLKANETLVALTDGRIYGEQPPARPKWPFIRFGVPVSTPYEASDFDGSEHDVIIHAFARGPGMDACSTLCRALERALDDFDPVSFSTLDADWTNTQIIQDGDEADCWHGLISFHFTTV